MRSNALAVVLTLVTSVGAASCATAPEPSPPPKAAAPEPPGRGDVTSTALCQMKARVDDARSRHELPTLRLALEREAAKSRAARFGATLAIAGEQERFRAFHDDVVAFPRSAVGPLGECFVYGGWKMSDQVTSRCGAADKLLPKGAIVDVARAEAARRRGALEEAQTLVDNALSKDNACAAALVEAARLQEARGDEKAAFASWERARASFPQCFMCAVEAARLTEAGGTRDDAVPLWEAALSLKPDAPDALKHYAAAITAKDPQKALAAYERAIAAGQSDVPTFLGAAQLAVSAGDVDKALGFAERATAAQPNEIDGWRLVLALATKKSDAPRALKAAQEVLRLVEEDLPALLVVARDARAQGKLVVAVERYDAAARAVAAGRSQGVPPADVEAAKKEHAALLAELKVAGKPARGNANAVIGAVQRTVQPLFAERLKKKKLKGMLEVAVTVSEAGAVEGVEIVKDTLEDTAVAAGVVASLRRAHISGGAKRYSFQMEFQ